MKKTLFTVVLLALVAQAMLLAGGSEQITEQQATDVNLRTLLNEIDNNEARANQTYNNRTLRLTGVATNIDSDTMWLAVSRDEEYNSLLIRFNSSERAKLINLNQYQRVTVRGVYTESGIIPYLRNAVIETAPTPATTPAPAPSATQQGQITIVNDTGYTIWYVYLSPSTDTDWGPDRLDSSQTIRNGQSITLNLPTPIVERYDIRLIDSDGDTYTKMNVNVTANSRIVFTFSDFD